MGKQSSRIFYQGKDHKDIAYKNNMHYKMYKNGQLIWEKLFPDEYFVLGTIVGRLYSGLHIVDTKNKFIDKIPFANLTGNRENIDSVPFDILGCINKILFGKYYYGKNGVCFATSTDGENWKKIQEIRSSAIPSYNLGATATNGNVPFPYWTFVDNTLLMYRLTNGESVYTLFRFDNEGNFIDAVETPYYRDGDMGRNVVGGIGQYYHFYHMKHIAYGDPSGNILYVDSVDTNGNAFTSQSYILSELGDGFHNLVSNLTISLSINVGSSIYLLCRWSDTRDSDLGFYIGKVNKVTHQVTWNFSVRNNFDLCDICILYSDVNETVIAVTSRVSLTNNPTLPVLIISFKENSYEIVNVINGPIQVQDVCSKDIYNVWTFARTDYRENEIFVDVFRHQPYIYMKDKELNIKKNNGICVYGYYVGDSAHRAAIYFDNVYFLESENNFVTKFPINGK